VLVEQVGADELDPVEDVPDPLEVRRDERRTTPTTR
jgi:hypothetical protein